MALNEQEAKAALNGQHIDEGALEALLRCTASRDMLEGFASIAARCGFSGLSYILLGNTLGEPRLVKHWTTSGSRWVTRYSLHRHYLVDPRITLTSDRAVPVIWDATSDRGDPHLRAFFLDAEHYAIRSGVAWSTYDTHIGQVVIAWDSDRAQGSAALAETLRGKLGSLLMLAGLVHEIVSARAKNDKRRRSRRQLTTREAQCVALAARGMTSADVAVKLGITERTANFHFGNVMAKLGALNRSEAIAKAVAYNMVSLHR
jgi:DNA-binding CsgD family transcriptional regulator